MKDYSSKGKIYTFLGTNRTKETIEMLLHYIKKEGLFSLNLIPEYSIKNNSNLLKIYSIEEERDHFDYIYKISDLAHMKGKDYYNLRHIYNMFENKYTVETRRIDITSKATQNQIIELLEIWKTLKKQQSRNVDESEFLAIRRYFSIGEINKLVTIGNFSNDKLIGFCSVEIVQDNYCMGHFEKTHHDYRGLNIYIRRQMAKELMREGIKYLNAEQDLGIEGLRIAKTMLKPVSFLKKYTIKTLAE
jgi:uncharacterized protein